MTGLSLRALHLAGQSIHALRVGTPAFRARLPAILFALRLSASVCLALYIAFWFQLDAPYWAGTSASIVAQPGLGASLRKGRFRAIGTFGGGLVIVLLVALFPQNSPALLASLTLWACICGCLATVLSGFASYAAALAGFTAVVVFVGIVDDPNNVFMIAVWRVTEVGIGIVAATVVHALTDIGNARARLARALGQIGQALAAGLLQTLRAGVDGAEHRSARRALIQRAIALRPTAEEAIAESSLRSRAAHLEAGSYLCIRALSAWCDVANHLHATSGAVPVEGQRVFPELCELSRLDWVESPAAVRQLAAAAAHRAAATPISDLSGGLVVEGACRVLRSLEDIALTLMVIENGEPGRQTPPSPSFHLSVPDFLPVILNALRIGLALTAAELVWVFTAWPHGPRMITFTAVGVILFSARPDDGHSSAIDYAAGTALAGVLAAVLNLAVFPGLHGDFLSLAVVLCLTFIPLGILIAGSWRTRAFTALATNLIPILAIQNERSYDATDTFNVAIGMFAGTVAAAISLMLLPPLSPERRKARLLALTWREVRELATGSLQLNCASWIRRISARIEVMPAAATLEDHAQLLAAFSIGEAAICRRESKSSISNRARPQPHFAQAG